MPKSSAPHGALSISTDHCSCRRARHRAADDERQRAGLCVRGFGASPCAGGEKGYNEYVCDVAHPWALSCARAPWLIPTPPPPPPPTQACTRHGTAPTASAALGRALLGTLLLACFRGEGEKTHITFRGDGPLGSMQVRRPRLWQGPCRRDATDGSSAADASAAATLLRGSAPRPQSE